MTTPIKFAVKKWLKGSNFIIVCTMIIINNNQSSIVCTMIPYQFTRWAYSTHCHLMYFYIYTCSSYQTYIYHDYCCDMNSITYNVFWTLPSCLCGKWTRYTSGNTQNSYLKFIKMFLFPIEQRSWHAFMITRMFTVHYKRNTRHWSSIGQTTCAHWQVSW